MVVDFLFEVVTKVREGGYSVRSVTGCVVVLLPICPLK